MMATPTYVLVWPTQRERNGIDPPRDLTIRRSPARGNPGPASRQPRKEWRKPGAPRFTIMWAPRDWAWGMNARSSRRLHSTKPCSRSTRDIETGEMIEEPGRREKIITALTDCATLHLLRSKEWRNGHDPCPCGRTSGSFEAGGRKGG